MNSIIQHMYLTISKKYKCFDQLMSIFQKHVNISLNVFQIDAGTLHGGAVSGHGGWQVSLVPQSRSSVYMYIYIYISICVYIINYIWHNNKQIPTKCYDFHDFGQFY